MPALVNRCPLGSSDAAPFRGFGSSVGLQGDQAIVGSPLTGLGGNAAEAAYVFRTAGGTWVEPDANRCGDGEWTTGALRSLGYL